MTSPGRDDDHRPMSIRALASSVGISEGIVRQWRALAERPLRCDSAGPRVTVTTAQLREFCEEHPERPAAQRALRHLDTGLGPDHGIPGRALLGHLLRTVRDVAAAQLDFARAAVGQSDQITAVHRAHVDTLAAALSELDRLLVAGVAPDDPSQP